MCEKGISVCTSIFPVYRLYLCIGAHKNLFWNHNMRPFIGRSYLILLLSPLLPRLRLFLVNRSDVISSPSQFIGCLGPVDCHLVTARKRMRSIGRVGSHSICFGEPAFNIVPASTVVCGYVPFSLLVRRKYISNRSLYRCFTESGDAGESMYCSQNEY